MPFFTDYTNLILLAVTGISGALLAWPVLTRAAHALSVQQAVQLINRRHAIVVDLRGGEEYRAGHLPQARHVAFEKLCAQPNKVVKNKKAPILLVCQKGQCSKKAQAVLKQVGYSEVFTLHGGINAWGQGGMPMVK